MLRRFFPVVIAVPFLFGWLIVRVHRTGEIDTPFAVTVFAMAIVVFLAAMLFWALMASGQIIMRKIDGWETMSKGVAHALDLAA